ncbi:MULTISPECIES: peptidoglycan D,D-transpeptidase FtsI family protein [Bacillus]|uniref:peptidoglycan D,D-transpeptidase FtsI family protein n=1 Tax=Bacillus TaxID=1386 RepID=UPI000BB80F1F|nr:MULTISPECIES: penicillin-binding protein 2 [Bacillus]
MQKTTYKRLKVVSYLFIIGLFFLIMRLMHIQLISPESFSKKDINLIEASVQQRTQALTVDEGRGRFVDRNNKPLTHDYYPTLILFPFLQKLDWPKDELASILQISETHLEEIVQELSAPVVVRDLGKPLKLTEEQMEKINSLKYPGIIAMYRSFSLDKKAAEQLIGITGENETEFLRRYKKRIENQYISPKTPIGVTGLEQAFDEFLLPEGSTQLLYHVDRYGGSLFGIDVRYSAPSNPFYPLSIKTTIDRDVQLIAEEIANEYKINRGGILLLDIETNEVLAMVSKPSINWKDPFSDNGTKNVMVERHFPGSVFKTIIAAGAIEENLVSHNRMFDCNLDMYGESKDNKGLLDFEASFAQSCNYTFAKLGQELENRHTGSIEGYSEKLGLLTEVVWQGDVFHFHEFHQLPQEETGMVMAEDNGDQYGKDIAQTSIGQREVKVTPIAVANMMATIARGGKAKQVKIVKELDYKNGTMLYSFPNHELSVDSVSKYTVMKLQHMLREVVEHENGTGRRFQTLPYGVAGKSGTAQTGLKSSGGQELVHRWFAGYFPFENPKYSLVVVELDVVNEQSSVTSMYYDMVNKLYQYNELQ